MIRQAAIGCGGRGTRLGAVTADIPKPLLPIGETAQFRIHKDKLILRVAEGSDNKEREYIVVSMTPREQAPAAVANKN